MNFGLIGVGAAVAPRHLRAIADVGGRVVAAFDPRDSVAILDAFGDLEVPYFTDLERFHRLLEDLSDRDAGVRYLSVCSPNYLHEEHCRLGLRVGADVICEKPVVIEPSKLDALQELEAKSECRIWTVLQLRTDERLMALRQQIRTSAPSPRHEVVLTYVTARGRWYDVSWKGDVEKSGGIATNIGVHMFDLLVWLFGAPVGHAVHLHEPRRMAGALELERARVTWLLSVEDKDLPRTMQAEGTRSFRAIEIDGTSIDFSSGFSELHTRVYERILAGEGFGLDDARPSIDLAYRMRHASVDAPRDVLHPFLRR